MGAGEILYQIFKEVVSTRLNKCKVNSIKVVLVSVRLSFGAKGGLWELKKFCLHLDDNLKKFNGFWMT